MSSNETEAGPRTPWSWVRNTPLSTFVRTETGSAALLLAATVLALLWVASRRLLRAGLDHPAVVPLGERTRSSRTCAAGSTAA